MKILGIDPGTATTGYGIIEISSGRIATCITHGVIKTAAKIPLGDRLLEIGQDIRTLLEHHKPDAVGIEELFFYKNVTNAMSVSHARGVVMYEVYQKSIPCYEYTPLQIKQAMTGYGRATKSMMQDAVKQWLKLDHIPKPDDAADGLAVALTTWHGMKGLR
jgi:crossover junction endodeoxyribonuclease RuvC